MYITPSERQKIILDRIRSCSVRQNEGGNIPALSSKKTDATDTTPIVMNINKVYGHGFDYDMFVQPTEGSVETPPQELFEIEEPDKAIETSLLSDDTVLVAPAQQSLHASLISTDDEDSVEDNRNNKINLDESLLSDYYEDDNNSDRNATRREFAGATVAGTFLGLLLGGPLGAVAVGASSAFLVNRHNDAAKIVRKGGESVANLGDRVYKHSPTARASVHTGQKTISEARKVLKKHKILQRLQEMDNKHQIRQRAFCGCVDYDPTTGNNGGRYLHSHGGGASSSSDKSTKTAKRSSSRPRRSRSNSKSSVKSTSTGSDVGGGSTSMTNHNHNRDNIYYAESTATTNADDFEETYTIEDYIPSVDDNKENNNKKNNNSNTNLQEDEDDEVKFDTDPLTGKRLLPLPSMWNQKNYQRVYI